MLRIQQVRLAYTYLASKLGNSYLASYPRPSREGRGYEAR